MDIIHAAGDAGEDLTTPLIDAAGDAREALAHAEHHAEKIADLETATDEAKELARQATDVANAAIMTPVHTVDHEAREAARLAQERVAALEAQLAEQTKTPEEVIQKPEERPVEPGPEKPKMNILGFLHRIK